jgi:hypothetical protein
MCPSRADIRRTLPLPVLQRLLAPHHTPLQGRFLQKESKKYDRQFSLPFLPCKGSEWLDSTFILAFLFYEFYFIGGMRRATGEIRLHDKIDLHVAKNTSIGKRIEPILSTKMINI